LEKSELVSQTSDEELQAHRAEQPGKNWHNERAQAIVTQHANWLGVIAEESSAAPGWAPPQGLAADCKLVAGEGEGGIRIQHAAPRKDRDGPSGCAGCEVRRCDLLLSKLTRHRCEGDALKFRSDIAGKVPC
jgi:hypothetical protein